MAYNEKLADRMREKLMGLKKLEEKKMMGGLCFLYKTKMCSGIVKDELMVRVIESRYEEAFSHPYCREMDFTGRPLKGFVYVSPDGFRKDNDLSYWLDMGIEYVESLPRVKLKKKVDNPLSSKTSTKKVGQKTRRNK